jgi:hypothetical protein
MATYDRTLETPGIDSVTTRRGLEVVIGIARHYSAQALNGAVWVTWTGFLPFTVPVGYTNARILETW